jgi:hypothetical protein
MFITCEIPIVVLAIIWLVESVRKNDVFGAILLSGVVFVFLTALNYWRAARSTLRPKRTK